MARPAQLSPVAYAALLRGVNLGPRNKLPMKDLARLFLEAGASDVRTYIQSGNVVFRAREGAAARIAESVGSAIASRFGFRCPVVTRTAAELAQVVRRNPFLKASAGEDALHVAFLLDRPPRSRIRALDPARSPHDAFAVLGREIYLHCPNGYGGTKLTNQYFDTTLNTTSTVRNWRTVLKLVEMTKSIGAG